MAMIARFQKDAENIPRENSEEGKEFPGDNDVLETWRELLEKKTQELQDLKGELTSVKK